MGAFGLVIARVIGDLGRTSSAYGVSTRVGPWRMRELFNSRWPLSLAFL